MQMSNLIEIRSVSSRIKYVDRQTYTNIYCVHFVYLVEMSLKIFHVFIKYYKIICSSEQNKKLLS